MSAAASLLFDEGIGAVTFDKVAALAGASKMTLYKWWPSPGALALDAYFHSLEDELSFPDTGDVIVDLRMQLHSFASVLMDPRRGEAIAGLIGAAQVDSSLAKELNDRYTVPRRNLAVSVLELAKSRGQILEHVDPESVVDQLWGACYHRLMLPARPLSEDFVDRLIDNLRAGICPSGS